MRRAIQDVDKYLHTDMAHRCATRKIMTKKNPQVPAPIRPVSIQSSLLGKSFRLDDDPEVYEVLGLKGRTKQVVLQAPSTEKIRTMAEDDFLMLASEIEGQSP